MSDATEAAREWLAHHVLLIPSPDGAYVPPGLLDALAALITEREAQARAEVVEAAAQVVKDAATKTGYGFFHSHNPHEFRPDPECTTDQERENHRIACAAYDRGETVPEQGFKPDATTFVNGVVVHQTGGPWGIGTYTFIDDELSNALVDIRALTPADYVGVRRGDLEKVIGGWHRVPDWHVFDAAFIEAYERVSAALGRAGKGE